MNKSKVLTWTELRVGVVVLVSLFILASDFFMTKFLLLIFPVV